MTSIRYVFNTRGDYVAYIKNENIFTARHHWYGFLRQRNLVYEKNGKLVGYRLDDGRIVKKINEPPRPRRVPPIEPIPPIAPILVSLSTISQ